MTTSFFMLQPVTGWETNHSQMTTSFFMLQPVTGWETNHSQMTTSFFMLPSWLVDIGFSMLDARISYCVMRISYPAVLLAPLLLAKQTEGLRKNEAAGSYVVV